MIRISARHLRALVMATALGIGAPATAAEAADAAPTVDLSAEAARQAPNDVAMANAYFEAADADPAALSKRVNAAIAAALEQARPYSGVKTSTSGVSTYPVYGKDGRKFESWRMRSEIQLESRDLPALSELLGKLQTTLAVSRLVLQPAPETRKSTADLAATDAIRAFEARAASIAGTLGRKYRIRHLSVAYGGHAQPVYPMMRTAALSAEAAPAPIEAGQTEVTVTVSGTIELTD